MAVSSIMQSDPSFHKRAHLSTLAASEKHVTCRGEPVRRTSASGVLREEQHDSTDAHAFCTPPESDAHRYELYEVLGQLYGAVRNERSQVSIRNERSQVSIAKLDQRTKRWLYQTAFEALNHRPLVEELLSESGFYAKNLDLHSHESLVHVMAYDFLRGKFAVRLPSADEEDTKIPPPVLRAADALRRHAVRLKGTLARMRIRGDATSLTGLLPPEARERYLRAVRHPHYARINTAAEVRGDEAPAQVVVSKLVADGFAQVHSITQLRSSVRAFFHGWKDLVAFSPDCRTKMDDHPLVRGGQLVLQDVSSYHLVERLMRTLDARCAPAHVVLTSPGIEALHVASSLKDRGTVSIYGLNPLTADLFQQRATLLGLNNIQLLQVPFSALLPSDSVASTITLIVCLPPPSYTLAIINPVDFILQEGDHLISSLFSASNEAGVYSDEQTKMLDHALEFVEVPYLVYVTRSGHLTEVESIIKQSLENHNASSGHYIPPAAEEREELGYCLAILEKVPLPTPSEVISRAITEGVLSGDRLEYAEKTGKTKKKKKKAKKVFNSSEGIPMTIAAQKKVVQKKSLAPHVKPFRY